MNHTRNLLALVDAIWAGGLLFAAVRAISWQGTHR
jgi:hypothetical protein